MSGEAPREEPALYEVACAACREPFDAAGAPWCACLTKERTLVCPRCKACFCKAPRRYRELFWSSAPETLWERKLVEHRRDFEPPPNPVPQEARRPLVLVVEDEPEVLQAAIRTVEGLGYGVVVARNGSQGVDLARWYVPNLILTDAFMPRLDGREMCRRLKNDRLTAGIPIVVMTSLYTSATHKWEAKAQFGVDEFLTKPLDRESLAGALARLLRS